MVLGAETPLVSNILAGAQSGSGGAVFVSGASPNTGSLSFTPRPDFVELSSEARERLQSDQNALNTLQQGRGDLERQAEKLLGDQLAQVREQIDFLRNLVSQASPEQREALQSSIEDVGNNLERIGRQLGLVAPDADIAISRSETSIESLTLSASFNQVAQIQQEDGTIVEVSQSLDVEFSFLKISSAEQALAINVDGQSADIVQSVEKNTLIAAQLNISSEQEVAVVQANAASAAISEFVSRQAPVDTVAKDFTITTKSFKQLVDEFQESLDDENRLPPSIFKQIQKLLESAVENNSNKQVDKVA